MFARKEDILRDYGPRGGGGGDVSDALWASEMPYIWG